MAVRGLSVLPHCHFSDVSSALSRPVPGGGSVPSVISARTVDGVTVLEKSSAALMQWPRQRRGY